MNEDIPKGKIRQADGITYSISEKELKHTQLGRIREDINIDIVLIEAILRDYDKVSREGLR